MADRSSAITARLLQVHFAMHRNGGAVALFRAPAAELGGERIRHIDGSPDELRTFTDAAEAEAFVRAAITEGDVVGMAWSPDEQHVFARLQLFGELLSQCVKLNALIIGPGGTARVQLRRDNLKHVAEVMGTAALLRLDVVLEQEVER